MKSWRSDEAVNIRKGKVKHVVTEKFHSLYCQSCNFPLDQYQVDQGKIYSFKNSCPNPMMVGREGWFCLTLTFSLLVVNFLVTDWLTHLKNPVFCPSLIPSAIILVIDFLLSFKQLAQTAGAVEYTNCISAKGWFSCQRVSWIWHKTIWWWGSSNTRTFGNVEYSHIAITPSPLWPRMVAFDRDQSMGLC